MVKQQILHLLPLASRFSSAEPEHLFRICLRFVKLNPFPPLCAACRRAPPAVRLLRSFHQPASPGCRPRRAAPLLARLLQRLFFVVTDNKSLCCCCWLSVWMRRREQRAAACSPGRRAALDGVSMSVSLQRLETVHQAVRSTCQEQSGSKGSRRIHDQVVNDDLGSSHIHDQLQRVFTPTTFSMKHV